MLHKLKYAWSHAPFFIMTNLKQIRSNIGVHYLGHGSTIVLMVALCMGLYTRWLLSQDIVILVIALLAVFIFAISCALIYYFSMERVGISFSRLWIGCLLGVLAFTEQVQAQNEATEQVMNALLLTSLGLHTFYIIVTHLMHVLPREHKLFDMYSLLELLGMMIATLLCDKEFVPISLLICALAVTVVGIRLKSYLAVVNLFCLIIVSAVFYFPKLLQMPVNAYALVCFTGRLCMEPILDIFFLRLTTLERWQPFLSLPSILRRLSILLLVVVEVTFFAFYAKQMPRHKEWYIVVPIFAAFSIIWWCYHIVFVITCWQLMTKITDCNATYRSLGEETRNMGRIMASKGVRHFSLLAQRVSVITLIATVILAMIGWETKTAISVSVLFMVTPLEAGVTSLLWDLGATLGGTCTGYALVAPVLPNRVNGGPTLLAPTAMAEQGQRAASTLTQLQRFFAHHLIDMYGCDYSSSGLTADSIASKLRSFFQRQTGDGPRFGTYLVYYSGLVHENGDWALAGEDSLKLDTILEWWREWNNDNGSRLILVLDSLHSHQWVREVRHLASDIVGIQTCRFVASIDPEEAASVSPGDFTSDWVRYNCAEEHEVDWRSPDRCVRAIYGLSRCWADFQFHLPTEADMEQHWDTSFPRITKPLIRITNLPGHGLGLLCCFQPLIRCLRRKRLLWLPPAHLDTGHGFRLVRS